MTLYTQVSQNRTKTVVYLLLFSVLFLAVGYAASWYFNAPDILLIAAVLIVIQGASSVWFSDSIALTAARAIPLAEALDAGSAARIDRIVDNLCITAGLQKPRIYIIPEEALNAFATGRDQAHAAVAITHGAVTRFDDNELSGVLAHELSHIGNEDIRLMGVVMVMAGGIALISDLFFRNMFFGRRRSNNDGDAGGALAIVAIVLMILAPIAATMIQLAISRKREFMADATGVLITRYPEGLIGALEKIEEDEAPMQVVSRGSAFMYFSNPLRGHTLANLFSSHPPIEERIAALKRGSGMAA